MHLRCGIRCWEDGTHAATTHRDFKERSVVLAVAHPRSGVYLFLSLFAVPRQSSERVLPPLVVLGPAISLLLPDGRTYP